MTLGLRLPTWHGWALLVPIVPLCALSVLSIQATGELKTGHWLTNEAFRQIAYILLGVAAMLVTLAVGYQRMGRWSFVLFWGCVLVLGYVVMRRWVKVPLVELRKGSYRWIDFGPVQIQPSELMKVAYVLAVAWYLRWRRNYRTLRGLIPPFALTLVPMALIKLQPDLGTVLLFLPALFAMLFAAGAKGRHLGVIIALGVLAMPVFWFKIEKYQRLRVTGVFLQSPWIREKLEAHPALWDRLRPEEEGARDWLRELREWERVAGFQLMHSKTAVGSGGLLGQGYGQGPFVEDKGLLPERHNDFVFAMIAHQWGLWGAALVVVCFGVMVVIGMDAATMTRDPFGRLVAVGYSTLLAVQTLTNLCMTLGLGPVTGVTLPFVSAGGSSMIASFICIGLIISVAQHRRVIFGNEPFYFDEEIERYQNIG